MIHSMRKQDLHAIAARLNLALSGTKQELFHRLLNHEKKIHTRISISSETKSQTKRVSGRRFPLRGLEIELSRALGIRNRILEIQAVMQMNLSPFSETLNCIMRSMGSRSILQIAMLILDYKSIKKFATFALTKPVVMNKNPAHQTKALTLFLKRLTPTTLKKILTELVSGLIGGSRNNTFSKCVSHIFRPVNPFRPGFVSGKSNQIFLTVLSEVNTVTSSASCNWNHLFFSYPLRRTLTAFESLYLNAAIFLIDPSGKFRTPKAQSTPITPACMTFTLF